MVGMLPRSLILPVVAQRIPGFLRLRPTRRSN